MPINKLTLLILLLTFLSGSFTLNRLNIESNIEVRYLLFFVFAFFLLIELGLKKENFKNKINKSLLLFLLVTFLYLISLLSSFFYTIDQTIAFGKFEQVLFIGILILSIVLVTTNMNKKDFFNLISSFFILIGLLYVIPVYLSVFSGADRGTTDLSGPNVTTRILFFASCSSFYRFFVNKKNLYFLIGIIFTFGIILVGSRGGLVGATLAFSFLYLVSKLSKKWRMSRKITLNYKYIVISIMGIFVVYFIFEPVKRVFMNRIIGTTFNGNTVYTSGRDVIYTDAIKMILEKPFFGHGLNSFTAYTGYVYPHNLLLEMVIEVGLLGAIVFVVFVFYSFFVVFKAKNSTLFIYSGIPIYMIIVQMFSGEFFDFRYYFLWIIPLIFYLSKYSKRDFKV